jgi:selenocysteine lyase/cysteine desulfurase
MLASQRALFEMPRDVCYLNAAGWGPLPRATVEAARQAAGRKATPWLIDASFAESQHERARAAAAGLIGADPADVALISSVGYGVSTAAKLISIPRGSRVLLLADDHSSPVLEWLGRAEAQGFTIDTVPRPADGDWTTALAAAIGRRGAAPVALASISSVHWSDGGVVDLTRVAPALKAAGAALLVDFTHGAGVMDLDVKAVDPDFVIFPTYKWLLGPYGRAFLYVARRHQQGVPLEQTAFGRRAVRAEHDVYLADTSYVSSARRFDMGERDHFISLEMASLGIELVQRLGLAAIRERLGALTGRLADAARSLPGVEVPDPRIRAPHILSLGFRRGMPKGLVERLAAERVYVAPRLGRLRISPHVYNDEADIDRATGALAKALG